MIRKIIMFIILFSILIATAYADNDGFTDYEFGSTTYMADGSTVSLTGTTNVTYCQPITFAETGTLKQIMPPYRTDSITQDIYWCLSTAIIHPMEDFCTGTGTVRNDFTIPFNVQEISYSVTTGTQYYYCIGAVGTVDIMALSMSDYLGDPFSTDEEQYFSVHIPLDDYNKSDYNQSSPYKAQRDLKSGGAWLGWAERQLTISGIQYCYEINDSCYVNQPDFQTIVNSGTTAGDWVGQVFEYDWIESTIDSLSMILGWGSTTSGAETFRFYVADYNPTTNVTTLIYNSTDLSYNVLANCTLDTCGYHEIEYTLNKSISFETGNWYFVGVGCTGACSSGATTDSIFTQKFSWGSVARWGDWKTQGYRDKNSFYHLQIVTDDSYNLFDTWFKVKMDDDIRATGVVNATTNCTTWSSPYILKENFNGYINLCDWSTLENVNLPNELVRVQSDDLYSIFKYNDYLEKSDSRYFTVSFDIKPDDIASDGWVAISLYDKDYQRFIQFLISENGTLYNNEEGDAVLKYSNVTFASTNTINLHVDLSSDDFDLWLNGVIVSSSLEFVNSFMDIDNVYGIRISSNNAGYTMDNLEMFASDQNNNPLLPDIDLVTSVDDTVSFCGLFSKVDTECTEDSDCESDDCQPNGKCNKFDMTYCDENGHIRGNYCLIAGITSCGLESTTDLILDNFILFLVFLILLILVIYLIIMVK